MPEEFEFDPKELQDAIDFAEVHVGKEYSNQPDDCANSEYEEARFIHYIQESQVIPQRVIPMHGLKSADINEVSLDQLDWFITKRDYYRKEFESDWDAKGLSRDLLDDFIDGIQNCLYKSKSAGNSGNGIRIKRSVWNYLHQKNLLDLTKCTEPLATPLLTTSEVDDILEINHNLIFNMFSAWLSETKQTEKGTNGIYFRRGLHLSSVVDIDKFEEIELILCNSLSISVAEQFAQIANKAPSQIPHILRSSYNVCMKEILFTSLIIENPNTSIEQYEFGVLPVVPYRKMQDLGEYKNMHEYVIDYES